MTQNVRTTNEVIAEAIRHIRARWPSQPVFGLILGTGSGQLADELNAEVKIGYEEIPGFPLSTALGHEGKLVCGTLEGKPVIAMQGRFHLYEGYDLDQATFPIHVFHGLGIQLLIVSNASGGVNPKYHSGDIVVIQSHIDLMLKTSPSAIGKLQLGRPVYGVDCYDPQMIESAIEAGRRNAFAVHKGVYAGLSGPNYETRAEYRMIRKIGGDVVGMSTVPEAAVASRYKMRFLGISIVTNVAKPDHLEPTSGQEVIDAAKIAAPRLSAIVHHIVQNFPK